jgi:hypothetical protein
LPCPLAFGNTIDMRRGCLLVSVAVALGCAEPAPTDNERADVRVASVQITPDSVDLPRFDTLRLRVSVLTVAGSAVPDPKVDWTSSQPAVAEVGLDGLLRAYGGGRAIITARVGDRTGTVRVIVQARESFNIAVLYGTVRDTRGNPIMYSALRAHAYVSECTGRPLIEAKFSTSSQGTFRRLMATPSILESFPGCVILQVTALHGSGLQSLTTDPEFVRFVDNRRGLPTDSLRLDLVLEDSGAVR